MANRVKSSVRVDYDSGVIESIQNINKDKLSAFVGVQSESVRKYIPGEKNHPTNAQIAFWQEFGTSRIPERSFIRSTIHEKLAEYRRLNEIAAKQILEKKITPRQHLVNLGEIAQNDIKLKIRNIKTPELADSTKAARVKKLNKSKRGRKYKFSDIERLNLLNPLVDTGQLLSSIRYKIGKLKDFES